MTIENGRTSRHASEEDLALAASGDLEWWRHQRVARHLRRCASCQSRRDAFAQQRAALGALSVADTQGELEPGSIAAAVLSQIAADPPRPPRRSWFGPPLIPVLATAGVLVIALFSVLRLLGGLPPSAASEPLRLVQEADRERSAPSLKAQSAGPSPAALPRARLAALELPAAPAAGGGDPTLAPSSSAGNLAPAASRSRTLNEASPPTAVGTVEAATLDARAVGSNGRQRGLEGDSLHSSRLPNPEETLVQLVQSDALVVYWLVSAD